MSDEEKFENESEEKLNSDEGNLDEEFEEAGEAPIDIPGDFEIDLPKTYLDLPDFEWDVDFPGKKKKKM